MIRLLKILICCAVFLPALAFAQTTSDDDKGFITNLLEESLGGEGRRVLITGFRGALSSTATATEITISDPLGVWLTLSDLTLKWNRGALLRGRIEIDQLAAKSISLERLPEAPDTGLPAPEAQEFKLPELPVSVQIADLSAEEITLGRAVLGEPIELSLKSALSLSGGSATADILAERTDGARGQFKINSAYDDADGQLKLDIDLSEAADGIAARLLNIPGRPLIDLTIAGEGPIDDFESDVRIATDGQERLGGTVRLGAQSTAPDIPATRALSADLQGDVTALFATKYRAFFGENVALQLSGTRTPSGVLDLPEFRLSTQELNLNGALALDANYWPTRINLSGSLRGDGPILLPLPGVETRVDEADLQVVFDADDGNQWQGAFNASGVSRADLRVSGAVLSASGTIIPTRDADALTQAGVTADVTADLSGLEFTDPNLSQAVGENVRGALSIDYKKDIPLRISNIDLTSAGTRLTGLAVIDALETGLETALDARLQADDLNRFSGILGRAVDGAADLTLKGSAALGGAFDLAFSGTTQDLRVDQAEADKLLRGETRLNVVAARTTDGLRLESAEIENAQIDLSGGGRFASGDAEALFEATVKDASLISPRLRGPLSVQGALKQDANGWSVDAEGSGPFGASATAAGLFTGPNAALDYTADLPEIRALVPGLQGPLRAVGTLERADAGWLIRTDLDGPYGATAGVAGRLTGANPAFQYTARLPNLASFVPEINGPLLLDGRARQEGADWQIATRLRGPAGTVGDVEGRVRGDGTLALTALGTAPLGLAEPFLRPRSLQGVARYDLAINGPARLSSVSGTVTTTGARFSAPTFQVALSDISGQATLANGRANLRFDGAVSSGGQVSVRGPVGLTAPFDADLDLSFQGVAYADPTLYKTTLDGAFTVRGPLRGGARLGGVLDVGRTEILVPSSGITSFGAIPDISHQGASAAVRRTIEKSGLAARGAKSREALGPIFPLDITVRAPNRIFVRGRGLDAELGGRLRLTGTTRTPISSGRFDLVRGRLDVLEKRFELNEGSVQLQGDFDPYLRLVARTITDDGTASIIVEGPASGPEIRFDAVPSAPQDEVLAQIFFRRDISQLSALQALQLASAVATLAGRGGEGIVTRLRRKFDLDDLDFTSDDEGNTGLRVGKYISDNVYTDVTTTTAGEAEVSINIDLTPNLTARGSISNNNESKLGIFLQKDY